MVVSKHILENLERILADIGLTSGEIEVFTHLLQSSAAERISVIARKTKLNRTTTYGFLKSLAIRGLVSSVDDGGVLTYRSIQPHLLVDFIERTREKLFSDIERVKDMIPSIEEVRKSRGRTLPSVQFFYGAEGLKQAYEDTLKNNREKKIVGFIGTDTVLSGVSVEMQWIENYISRRKAAGITWNAAVTASKNSPNWFKARDKQDGRVTKVLPLGYDFGIEIAIYGDKVLFASLEKEHPLVVLVEEKEIAKAMREIFRYVDSTLKE